VLGYLASPAGTGSYRSLSRSGVIDVLLQRVPDQGPEEPAALTCAHPTWTPRSRRSSARSRCLTSEPVIEDGWSWHILADPDGNEFCVLQPPGMPLA
jgi:hypothetical protein